jgi:hypothetical protein
MPVSVLPSILRTGVPLLVGYFLAWPAARAFGLTEDQVTSLITIVITALYYLAVRLLEQVRPQFGWLLGYASVPKYVPASAQGVHLITSAVPPAGRRIQ